MFVLLNPFSLLNFDESRRQLSGQSSRAESDKLGQDDVWGWIYYAGTLGWGFGWVPLAAALGGAVAALRRDWRRALLLLAFPVFLYLFLGAQGRFFGRWLMPAYPMLCVLCGYGVVALADALTRRPRRAAALVAGFTALVCAQGLLASIHVDTVLGRVDTREQARRWIDANVPARSGRGRRAVRPARVARRAGAAGVPARSGPFQAYEKRLRVRRIDRYRARGYCWVVVGSTQKQRGLKAGLRSSRNYYARAGRGERADGRVLALRARRGPGRVLLRRLVQLPPARVRASRARRGDPPAARLHPGARVIRRPCP